MSKKIGFIGAGNMGYAMISSIAGSHNFLNENIFVYDVDSQKLLRLKEETGVSILNSEMDIIQNADIIVLAVKPNMVKSVLEQCKNAIDDKKILVSIAVGIPLSFYRQILGKDKKIIRTMPNTPAFVGEGMTLMSYENNISEEDVSEVRKVFECFGKVEVLEEKLMSEV
ncbi:MAG: NAD(P)-binding domain-containing protein, partial [Clostridiaceae bacterium]|nr:NAD(P)-binding domain-containing protein [Clostridiaceae bacterium]